MVIFSFQQLNAQQSEIDSLLNKVSESAEDTNQVNLYRTIASRAGITDPRTGMHYVNLAISLSKKLDYDKGTANCFNSLGRFLAGLGKYDSSILKLDTAIQYALKSGDANTIALCYVGRANSYVYNSQLEKAQADCMSAIPFAERSGNIDRQARVQMTLGNILYYQLKFESAIGYYEKSLVFFSKIKNAEMIGVCFMNIASCSKELGINTKNNLLVEKAIVNHNKAAKIFDSIGNVERLINVYSNRGFAYMTLNKLREAQKDFIKAREISLQIGDVEMYASNSQLIGDLFIKQKKYDVALSYLLPALDSTKKYLLIDDEADVARSLSQLYEETGNTKDALLFLKEYYILKDTILSRNQNDELLQLQAKFEADKKNEEIKLLSKDTEIKEEQLARQKLIGALIFSALMLLLVLGFMLFYRYRKGRQIQELSLRNKIAADLHDDIGSTLSSIRMYSEMLKSQMPDSTSSTSFMLEKISHNAKESVESMSDIVWMINPKNDEVSNLISRIEQYATEMCMGKEIELIIQKSEGLENIRISMEGRKNIYLIFKEAINNAVKYSCANKITVSLLQTEHQLKMEINDNGKGFDVAVIKKGNGLDNMIQRAKVMNGEVKIISLPNEGTRISFSSSIP